MRMGHNKRMRSRNGNNNRKGPNPLTRSYESNGPDVKIRGTPHHVAEKYLQLARDAQTSGDPVMAESYLQHAEHYFRVIAAAQLQQVQSQAGYVRAPGEPEPEDNDDDDDVGGLPDRFASPVERQPPQVPFQPPQPQPAPLQNRPAFNGDRQGGDRFAQDRQGQDRQGQDRPGQDRPGQDRGPRQDRRYPDRNDRDTRQDRQGRDFRPRDPYRAGQDPQSQPQPPVDREPRGPASDAEAGGPVLPAFITAPVRGGGAADLDQPGPQQQNPPLQHESGENAAQFGLRSRRRRRTGPLADEGEDPAQA